MKVLVAEDNNDSRALLAEIIEALGHDVILAVDGVHAMEQVAKSLPDLFIIDVDMPRKDGFQVVEELKEQTRTASIPIILLTAQADIESRVKGLGLGADDYLTKPFNPRELMARVNTRLRIKAETDDLRNQREIIEATFSRFVAQEVIDMMLADPSSIQLGGQVRDITVFFADLEGFTSVAEYEDPVQLLEVLNQYHGLLVSVIKRNGGTVDKFLGDGLMALFNAPLDLDNHPFQAVKTAVEIRDALPLFQATLEPRFRLGINFGIHTGSAVLGTIGAADVMEYTAVGDTVNLASRIQEMSKSGRITISDAVYHHIADNISAVLVGPVVIKGREVPVVTYEVQQLK